MAVCLVLCGWLSVHVSADSQASPHYEFVESSLGNNSMLGSSSSNYTLSESVGTTAIGNSGSSNYQINAGTPTTADPSLSVIINNSAPSFGSFSPTATATTTSTFQVLDYTSYGYSVVITGTPPTNGTHTIAPMAITGAPQTGVDQFGINLVANTIPTTFGANPDHGQFGIGSATTNYGSANQFRYVSGESIASAPKSSGLTTYTISYIVNVNSLTPGGQYTSNQTLICIATY